MKNTEKNIQKEHIEFFKMDPTTEAFRNNTGVMQKGKRWIRFGLCKGSSDIIGYKTIKITPGMVGKNIAVFCAFEMKETGGTGTDEQIEFVKKIQKAGGIACISDSLEKTCGHIKRFMLNLKRKK